jgi:hypothetical protein
VGVTYPDPTFVPIRDVKDAVCERIVETPLAGGTPPCAREPMAPLRGRSTAACSTTGEHAHR